MCSRSIPRRTDTTMRIGMLAIVAGALSLRLHSWLSIPTSLADGVSGFFYGAAIASLLWSIRARHGR